MKSCHAPLNTSSKQKSSSKPSSLCLSNSHSTFDCCVGILSHGISSKVLPLFLSNNSSTVLLIAVTAYCLISSFINFFYLSNFLFTFCLLGIHCQQKETDGWILRWNASYRKSKENQRQKWILQHSKLRFLFRVVKA
jgi:hypothetical protein